MLWRLTVLAAGWVFLSALQLPAQAPVFDQTYGAGVHAYFSGDYQRAQELLSTAVKAGDQDPRAYYFRGLNYLRLGRPEEARKDFQQASKLETADQERMYNISKALERVQGADRMLLEQYRADARVKAYARAEEIRKKRYEELRREEARVLQPPPGAAPKVPPGSGLPVAPDVSFGEKTPPPKILVPPSAVGEGPAPPPTPPAAAKSTQPAPAVEAPKVPPEKKVPVPPPEENPFEAPSKAAAPSGKQPAPAKPAAAEKPAAGSVPPPATKDDFFAMPAAPVKPPEEKPAGPSVKPGAITAAKKLTGKKPAAAAGAVGEENPFEDNGGAAAKPLKKGTAPKKSVALPPEPADNAANPFDETAPVKKTSSKTGTSSKKKAAFGAGDSGNAAPNPFDDDSAAPPAGKKAAGKAPTSKRPAGGSGAAKDAAGEPNPFEDDGGAAAKKPGNTP